jgi:hypothetical protein
VRQELTSDMFVFEAAYGLNRIGQPSRDIPKYDDSKDFGLKEVVAVVVEPTLCFGVGGHLDATQVRWPAEQFLADPMGALRDYYTTHVVPSIDPTRYRVVQLIMLYERGTPERRVSLLGALDSSAQVGYWEPSPHHTPESGRRATAWRTDPR